MDNDTLESEAEAAFNEVLGLDSDEAREACLARLEGERPALAHRVRELIRAHDEGGEFMKTVGTHPPGAHVSGTRADEERLGSLIGRYKLLEKIGEGGFGSVYMAEQTEPVRRRVALKVIKLGMDTRQVVARFEAERQALALMDHPNIASVLDAGSTDSGRPFFVMELVRGSPITTFCDEHHLDTPHRLHLFRQVCAALQHAHQKGVIHRDLKPSNVMVTLHGDEPVPKVIDFGIAKATHQQLTEKTLFTNFGQFIGTPAYMSPEQAAMSGLDVDTRSDIYSLGVLLYELLTGRTPMDSASLRHAGYEEICRVIREEEPPKPSTRLDSLQREELTQVARDRGADPSRLPVLVRDDLDWIVMKALEKSPARRYESAHGLSQDIERFLNDEPVLAAAPSALYRLRKFARRHRVVVSLASSVAAALIVGAVVSTWQAVRATRAEAIATKLAQSERRAREAEELQRRRAEEEETRAVDALFLLRSENAENLIAGGDTAKGIAALARVVRDHPDRPSAATRLVAALRQRSFALPVKHAACREPAAIARVDPEGTRLLTVSPDGAAHLWDLPSERRIWGPIPMGPPGSIIGAVVGPRGHRAAFWTKSNTVHVLDARTGEAVAPVLRHDDSVLEAWFDESGDRLASGGTDGTVRIWSAGPDAGGTHPMILDSQGWIQWCEFSPDGSRIANTSRTEDEFKFQLWDTATGALVLEVDDFADAVQCVRFTRDGRTLVTASNDGTVRFHDAATGAETADRIVHPDGFGFFRVALSPEGERLLTVSILEKSARIWDRATGAPLTPPMLHKDRVYFADWSPDGSHVITRCSDQTARVWDAATGAPVIEPIRHGARLDTAEFIPGADRVLTVSSDHRVAIWDVRAGEEGAIVMRHDEGLYAARFSSDDTTVLSSASDGTARLWDARTGRLLVPPLEAWTDARRFVLDARFNADATRVVTASSDRYARLWNARTGALLHKLPVSAERTVRVACFSPDGRLVATGSDDGFLGLWDAETGERTVEPIHVVPGDLGGWNMIWSIEFSSDGRTILTSGTDGAARLWDTETGQPVGQPMMHEDRVASARFSRDGRRILTAGDDRMARQWDAATSGPIGSPLLHNDHVTSAVYAPDGTLILTASKDGTARVWDAQTGKPVLPPIRHDGPVVAARFDSRGDRFVTASDDGTARIWDARTGLPLGDPLPHGAPVADARFSSDGTRVLTASKGSDGSCRLWFVPPSVGDRVPSWLAEWAETVVALRVTPLFVPEFVGRDEYFELRERITSSVETDVTTQLAKWFFLDRSARSVFLGAPASR